MFISVCALFKATDWIVFLKHPSIKLINKSNKYKDVSPDWNKNIYLTNDYRYVFLNYPNYIVPWAMGKKFSVSWNCVRSN